MSAESDKFNSFHFIKRTPAGQGAKKWAGRPLYEVTIRTRFEIVGKKGSSLYQFTLKRYRKATGVEVCSRFRYKLNCNVFFCLDGSSFISQCPTLFNLYRTANWVKTGGRELKMDDCVSRGIE